MEIEKVTLIGHSLEGNYLLYWEPKYPELVEKIVLVNSAGLIPKRGPKYYFKVYSFKL